MRSTDGGASFVTVGSLPTSIVSLVFANRQDGYAFTTSNAASSSVFWTRDGGTTWQRIELAGRLTQLVAAGGYAYALLCASSGCSSFSYAVSPVTESHWTTRDLPLAAKDQIVHLSASGSRLWLNLTPTGGGEARFLVSDNEGRTFSLVRSKGLSGESTLAVASSKSVLWGETLNGGMAGLSRSTDSGKNFVAFPESSSGASFLTMGARIYPLSDNEEVVADIETGLWRTENGGRSFTRMLPNRVVLEAAFASKTNWLALGTSWSPTGVNASAAHTLWRTNDGGLSWRLQKPLTTRTSLPSVDVAATPKGWVPIAFGDAQISVPPTWYASYSTVCDFPHAPGSVFVGRTGYGFCPPYSVKGVPVVYLAPEPSGEHVTGSRQVVNGLVVVRLVHNSFNSDYVIPALGVQLTLDGANAQRVLSTLTISPRALVLAKGVVPRVPSLWQKLSFAGVEVSVPPSWPVTRTDWDCGQSNFGSAVVILANDIHALSCPAPLPRALVQRPSDGLRIDVGIDAAPHTVSPTCLYSWCQATDAPYSVLVLVRTIPGQTKPLIVSIGLAGNGLIARTILDSLRPASTPVRGVLTGVVWACQGIVSPRPPIVTVYVYRAKALVTSNHLRSGTRYRFALPPGQYTVTSPPSSPARTLKVTVTAGKTTQATIINMCK